MWLLSVGIEPVAPSKPRTREAPMSITEMSTSAAARAVEAMAELSGTDVSGCDRGELDRVVALGRRVRGFVDSVDVQVARRSDRLTDQGHGDPAVVVLADGGRRPAAKHGRQSNAPGCATSSPNSRQPWQTAR